MKLKTKFVNVLKNKGYNIDYDKDGDIFINYKLTKAIKTDITCVVIFDEKDTGFLRVFVPNFWSIESEEEHIRALKIINSINEHGKLIKITVTNSDSIFKPASELNELRVCIGVEILVPNSISPAEIDSMFTRIMDNIEEFICKFSAKMLLVDKVGEENFDEEWENTQNNIIRELSNLPDPNDSEDESSEGKKTSWYN